MRILPALLLAASASAVAAPAALPPVPPPPSIDATAWVLVDQLSGHVLAGHRVNERIEPASITKLMTAYAVFQALKDGKLKLDTEVPISERAWRSEGSRTYLDVNTRVPVEVLIQGMIVQSGNDATIALAEAVAGTEDTFAALMNQYAERLGMTQSHFQNSTGLPGDDHKMSVDDIAKLTRALIRDFPDYYRWYSQREFTWNDIRQPNRNGLLARDPSVDGVKTGMTEAAGYCLVSSAKRDGTRLIAVVTGTRSMKAREDASLALLNYGFNFFETRVLKKAGEELAVHRIYKARGGHAAVGLARDLVLTLPRGRADRVEFRTELAPRVFAPLTTSDRVGTLRGLLDGKVVAEAPLSPLADVPRGNIFRRIWDTILSWFA
ncbi:MAG TPA: D-alanyl-D-alanine carboxypeptidase family protein [Steroidobacteraceae bacterium]|nr:D-alanyl-D-alanine carboxypeptidase family protein [Steroidobacteraceae bacterium]